MYNSEFEDIRPYNDEEVADVTQSMIASDELLEVLLRLKLPRWPAGIRQLLMKPVFRYALKRKAKGINSVKAFQNRIAIYMGEAINASVTELTFSGHETLPDGPCLFLSNHRDIAMDPALVNWVLFKVQRETVRIAIGDNLLSAKWSSDLMRINKSFIVKRSITAPRKLFAAFKTLSKYIRHSILEDHESVWIAQREGRAKDGNDLTEPAIIKMFGMAKEKSQSLGGYLSSLNIVPVTLTYEFDPCDQDKAIELATKARGGIYKKQAGEDIRSIGKGIAGFKGRVHVAFGRPMSFEDDVTADEVAQRVDQVILDDYRIFPSASTASAMLGDAFSSIDNDAKTQLDKRIKGLDETATLCLLESYARPVRRKHALLK